MSKILVTGGAGFIGSHTVALLLARGFEVIVYDSLVSGSVASLPQEHPQLEFVRGDILDYPRLLQYVRASDAVLHLAALSSVTGSIDDPVTSLRVNMLGFVHVLQAMREARSPSRLVYASSAAVYGNSPALPCRETAAMPAQLLSPYALQKADNERYAGFYQTICGIAPLGLRYFNVYGPGQSPDSPYAGVIAKFLDCYQAGREITVFGEGMQSRDFIHVEDVARANLLALQSECEGVLNIATGVASSLLELIVHIESAGGRKAVSSFKPARPGDIMHSCADIALATQRLGFRYTIGMQEGIASLMQAM